MLTCKVGNTIINCFDGKYDKHTLKKWDEEKRLICPDCGKLYEYCHGQVVTPYFRHKEKSKECDEIYSESETEEHIKGKTILYNWLLEMQNKGEISNLRLEGYIPETRQRPDLYFEKNNFRYVIEFQCTPIASEYLERHRLYELAGIKDIWILGTEKYNINIDNDDISHSVYYKTIENNTCYYLDSSNRNIIIESDVIRRKLPYRCLWLNEYYLYNINDLTLENKKYPIILKNNILKDFINQDKNKYGELIEREILKNKIKDIALKLVKDLNLHFSNFNNGIYSFEYNENGYMSNYICKIYFKEKYDLNNHFIKYTFFIKEDCIDCCIDYEYSKPFRGKRGGLGWRKCYGYKNIDRYEYNKLNYNILKQFIIKHSCGYIRSKKYGIYKE